MSAPRLTRGFAMLSAMAMLALTGCGSEADASATEEQQSAAATDEPTSEPSQSEADDPETPSPSASASASPDTEGWPACTQVWVVDQELPGRYPGCVDEGLAVAADRLGCSSGQQMIRFDDRFYGVPGGKVYQTDTALSDDRGYRAAVAICRG